MFPFCSIGIYFSSALVRLCFLSDLLLHVSEKCNTTTAEAVIEDFARCSCMHTSIFFSDTIMLLLLLEYVFVMT